VAYSLRKGSRCCESARNVPPIGIGGTFVPWAEKDLNLRRRKPAGLQPAPIGHSGIDPEVGKCSDPPTARPPQSTRPLGDSPRFVNVVPMPSFDIVSEVDRQEVRNAVDQANRELDTRFDFKNTNSIIEQKDLVLTLRSVSEDRIRAVRVVLEERLVKRGVSLKGIEWGKIEEASGFTARQTVTITVGIGSDKAKEINRLLKEKGPKGISSTTQGEQIRVTGKKRDELQAAIAFLKESDVGIPLQFENFRD
jgi:cyclic-di-GMP-binding protein